MPRPMIELDPDVEFVSHVPVLVHMTEAHLKLLDMMQERIGSMGVEVSVSQSTLVMLAIEESFARLYPELEEDTQTEHTEEA